MKIGKLIPIALLVILITIPAYGRRITIASWKIDQLRMMDNRGQNSRGRVDYKSLKRYAYELDADVIALQWIENTHAIERIFRREYDFYFRTQGNTKNAGFAVRRGITVNQSQSFYAGLGIKMWGIQGTDITVDVDGQEIRMLSVQLREGCWHDEIDPKKKACRILKQGMKSIKSWIDSRESEGIPFAIMGNFNRMFDLPGDKLWNEIDGGTKGNGDLSRITEGQKSNCWVEHISPKYLDHIILDKLTTGWVVRNSFKEIVYDERIDFLKKPSDHCPISVVIDIPSFTFVPSAPAPALQVQ